MLEGEVIELNSIKMISKDKTGILLVAKLVDLYVTALKMLNMEGIFEASYEIVERMNCKHTLDVDVIGYDDYSGGTRS